MSVNDIPLWLFAVDVTLLPAVFFVGGFLQGKRTTANTADGPIGAMVGSVLALLAFMLAFTFGMAASRFDERRHLVMDEANAIGTAYLRTDFVDEPGKTAIRQALRKYVLVRARPLATQADFDAAAGESNQLQAQIWTVAAATAKKYPTPISGLLVSAVNELIDVHGKRIEAGLYARVPSPVWLYLLAVSALAMSSVGYYCGKDASKASAVAVILITCYGAVLFLAADLDRPQNGTLKTNLQPLIDVAKQIGAQ